MARHTQTLADIVTHINKMMHPDTYILMNHKQKIEEARGFIFNFDYPFYDESKRADFETQFIRHFYFREIGFETEGMFQFYLENYLNAYMPNYNKMLWTTEQDFPLFDNMHQTTTSTKENERTSNTQNNQQQASEQGKRDKTQSDHFNRTLTEDTPDERLDIKPDGKNTSIQYASDIEEVRDNTFDDTKSDESSNQSSQEHEHLRGDENETSWENQSGKIGDKTYARLMQEYRQSILDVYKQIFNDCQSLFMLVYS